MAQQAPAFYGAKRTEKEARRCVPGTARLLAGESAQAGKSRPNQVTVKGSQGQGESR